MADQFDPERIRRYAQIRRREAAIQAAAQRALNRLAETVRQQLRNSGYDVSILSRNDPAWVAAINNEILPEIDQTFIDGLRQLAIDGTTTEATAYAASHLETVRNRLVGVADSVFDSIRVELRNGVLKGETIEQLAARVELHLGSDTWAGRARTIARTEAIGANNAGALAGARVLSQRTGVDSALVVKQWLATFDDRTRPTHSEASGQQVRGLDAPFSVGGSALMQPGDPAGPGREVINCRCTVLYLMPGDPGYPDQLAASGGHDMTRLNGFAPSTTQQRHAHHVATLTQLAHDSGEDDVAAFATRLAAALAAGPEDDPDPDDATPADVSTVVVALPVADDAVHTIGPADDKHATVLWFGEVDDDTATGISDAVKEYAATAAPFEQSSSGSIENLGDDEPQAVVLLLDVGGDLSTIRDDLLAQDTISTPWSATKQWPTFTPHITLGYGDEVDDEARAAAAAVTSVTFDRLAVWVGDDQTGYLLGEQVDDDAANDDDGDDSADGLAAAGPADGGDISTAFTWSGVAVVEGIETGDKRKMREDSIVWMEDPGTLFAMFDGGSGFGGHEDQVPVGIIREMSRSSDGQIVFSGEWGSEEEALKARRMNIEGTLRGVSVDLDDVEVSFEDADGNPVDGDELWDLGPDDEMPTLVIEKGRVRGATLWPIQAFVEAYVLDAEVADQIPNTSLVDASADEPSPLAIAASAALGITNNRVGSAPMAAFANPGLTEPTPLTVTDDGRVFGHIATWGTCHIGIDGACVTPPTSDVDYAYFLIGDYHTSDGVSVPVGKITMDTGHADLSLSASRTLAHYDNTAMVAAYINVGEDDLGIWCAGALREGVNPEKVRELQRAGALSGDWRKLGGNLELIAALAVNVPGFPIPRIQSRVASGAGTTSLVASGLVRRRVDVADVDSVALRTLVAREVHAYQQRQGRRELLRRRVNLQRRDRAVARINRK